MTTAIYRALPQHGPLTAAGLARAAGIAPRYPREWVETSRFPALSRTSIDLPLRSLARRR